MSAEEAKTVMDRFTVEGHKPYPKQAVFFLNAYWEEVHERSEDVWTYTQGFAAIDKLKEEGCDLDEFEAHKFLEKFDVTMTAIVLRQKLRKIDVNNDHKMSLLEFLLNKFEGDVDTLMSRFQEENTEALEAALKALEEVKAEIKRIEKVKSELAETASHGGVKGNAAKAELFKICNDDPTELNKMLITAQAAVRHAQKLTTVGAGQLWWISRELEEVQKYKPRQDFGFLP
eukprot:TRINITY_DN1036_c0_g1_i4.p1 TRINITY_DN1036_c0_g1~~TRINITY_DN1036_c0_g1_i4.p1  ORF type:complete len:253 (+),score=68.79 TRINITY_DN1036_c0_g1_i4:71-760(+)